MIILDIDMPTKCMNCPLLGRDNMYCQVYPRKDLNIIEVVNDKPEWCPIKSSIEDIKADIQYARESPVGSYDYDNALDYALKVIERRTNGHT